jgi:hypothetical protein
MALDAAHPHTWYHAAHGNEKTGLQGRLTLVVAPPLFNLY